MVFLNDWERLIYFTSQLLSAIGVCNLNGQNMGQSPYVKIYPDLDLVVLAS